MQLSPFCFDGERISLGFPNSQHRGLAVDLIFSSPRGIAWELSV
jgi:hypothetical protein